MYFKILKIKKINSSIWHNKYHEKINIEAILSYFFSVSVSKQQ